MSQNEKMAIYNAIGENIETLFKKIQPDNIDEWYEEVKAVIQMFTRGEKIRELIPVQDAVLRQLLQDSETNKAHLEKIRWLIRMLRTHEPDFLLERLKRIGGAIAQNKTLRDALNKQMFRILEQVRLGKRDSAVHMILRTFAANHRQIPQELVDTMREEYDINQFRAFMYAFLNNFIAESNIKEDNYAE